MPAPTSSSFSPDTRILAASLALAVLGPASTGPARAAESASPKSALMAYETAFCAQRRYDAKHLAAHRKQTVEAIAVAASAGWNIAVGRDLPYSEPTVLLQVKLRGKPPTWTLLSCSDYDEDQPDDRKAPGAQFCASVCGGGILRITVAGSKLTLRSYEFEAQCGVPGLDGPDDRVFVLDETPTSACALPKGLPTDEKGVEDAREKLRAEYVKEE